MSTNAIDPVNCFPIEEVPAVVPGNPSVQTIWRWIGKGVIGVSGRRVKLESFKVAGRRFVAREAIDRFILAFNEVASSSPEREVAHV